MSRVRTIVNGAESNMTWYSFNLTFGIINKLLLQFKRMEWMKYSFSFWVKYKISGRGEGEGGMNLFVHQCSCVCAFWDCCIFFYLLVFALAVVFHLGNLWHTTNSIKTSHRIDMQSKFSLCRGSSWWSFKSAISWVSRSAQAKNEMDTWAPWAFCGGCQQAWWGRK